MNRRKAHGKAANDPGLPPRPGKKGEPDWAEGLRQLYNSVVEEPLPDSFDKLLKKLDENDGE
ncbi:MAG: NepR family anti-sigma factor [Novosphingobium sp.]